MEMKVFISMGSAYTIEQREFIDAVLDMLKTVGLSPRIMNENEWSHEQPLKAIQKIITECCGAVIIAFTRTSFEKGIEIKRNGRVELQNIWLPTPWNHIEASLAYSCNLPLLVVAENGLKSEGLIEDGYDWRVYWTNLDKEVVKTDSFKGFLRSWKNAVDNYHKNREKEQESNLDIEKMKVSTLIKSLTVPQLWKILGILFGLLTAVATAGYKIGSGKWPWG